MTEYGSNGVAEDRLQCRNSGSFPPVADPPWVAENTKDAKVTKGSGRKKRDYPVIRKGWRKARKRERMCCFRDRQKSRTCSAREMWIGSKGSEAGSSRSGSGGGGNGRGAGFSANLSRGLEAPTGTEQCR